MPEINLHKSDSCGMCQQPCNTLVDFRNTWDSYWVGAVHDMTAHCELQDLLFKWLERWENIAYTLYVQGDALHCRTLVSFTN